VETVDILLETSSYAVVGDKALQTIAMVWANAFKCRVLLRMPLDAGL
jgi:hypothetical protein